MRYDGHFPDDERTTSKPPLTEEQKLLCSPLVQGYALSCGPPGVGKTLTAESVSEQMKVPLYAMSAEPERNKLVSISLRTFNAAFQSRIHISLDYPELNAESRFTIWKNFLPQNAPKADTKSKTQKLEANTADAERKNKSDREAATALGSLEGTATGDAKDTSTSSSAQATKKAQTHITNDHTITAAKMEKLSLLDLNGSQIKNVIKTSKLLASRRKANLSYEHIKTVLNVTQYLHNATKETDRQRSTTYY